MSDKRKTPSSRRRPEEPLTRPREPTRPPRTRIQPNRDNNTVHRNANRAEKVPMTALDENVNRVPRVHPTNEPVDRLGWQERIERVSMDSQDSKLDLGKPVPIVLAHPDHTFELNEEALAQILLQDDIKDRSVVVVSVAGAFRKGKSFLLDFFLRYMNCKYNNNNKTDSWLGKDDDPLCGFSWKGGSERDTTGILMWSKVFPSTLPSGEKIAVILMDTQGAFDSQSTVRDCATVFALSTMLSSVQIYNLSQNIQEDDLQHLQLFTEYGRLALEKSGSTPFQKLQFLVRDWSYPYEAEYGANGGKEILQRRLEISNGQHPELQSLRKHIKSCFSDISCFLMPHPGLNIATNPNFDGRLSEIQSEFKEQLKVLIPMLLDPENLVTKKIDGQVVKAKDLLEYFKSYMKIYKGDELPEPKSMLVATAEANNLTAVAEAKDLYLRSMETVCGGAKPFLATAHLTSEHMRSVDRAISLFQNKRKMGGDEFSQTYMDKLVKDMEEAFVQFKAHNESKNIFKAARTPAVFFVIAAIMYFSSGLFGIIGLYPLANICNFVVGLCIVTLILWTYVRYSGNFRSCGAVLDEVANVLWDNMFLTRSEYDHGVNTFSPEGRLFQVEYAIEAIKLGSTAIGIATTEGVVLAVEKRITSSLIEPATLEKIVEIDKHIGCAASGLIADSRTMIDRARTECQNHWFVYNEKMTVESTAQAVSNLAIQFGDSDDDGSAMSRPFGVAMLFAGIDEKGPQLYHMDPSGTFIQFDAKAIGSGSEGAQQNLEEVYHKSITLKEAIKAALTILKQVMEEKLNDTNIEVMTMTPEKLFHMFEKAELQEVIKDIA